MTSVKKQYGLILPEKVYKSLTTLRNQNNNLNIPPPPSTPKWHV
jgi:hypothetical protein